jgi:hypothetical protein
MLTNAQKALLKSAQRACGMADEEYRETLERYSGARSSTDGRVTDEHLDLLLKLMEGIYWLRVDSGTLQRGCKGNAIFRKRGYWASKNPANNTSRDRWAQEHWRGQLDELEAELRAEGYGENYFRAIRAKTGTEGAYRAALKRTLRAKLQTIEAPF